MLGWEFPPFFSGGLGVATYGMVKALSPKVDIKLIVPKSAHVSLSNVHIIGLNSFTSEELNFERLQYNYLNLTSEFYSLPLALSPYHYINEEITKNKWDEFEKSTERQKKIEVLHSFFSGNEVYGYDIKHKIHLYAQLVSELASKGDYDVIHAHDWITFPAALQLQQQGRKPLILHVHSLETDRAGEAVRNEIYELEKDALTKADRILAVSQFTKEQIIKHYAIDAAKIFVVHNGIEPAQTRKVPHLLRDKLVVFLGRITHQKGPEFLLETAEKVCRVYPRVKFIVAGTGDQFAHLLETSAYRKLGSKFIFAGFLTKARVDELLNMADVYFMPSISEPFGLTALEAAQHNVPAVLSNQSGAAEVMKCSLRADFWDTDKYANYIYALLKYNVLHRELSESAKHDLQRLTWEHAAEKINAVYQQFSPSMS
jgi:glycosyltransferase involved in cell wall biosynthesis